VSATPVSQPPIPHAAGRHPLAPHSWLVRALIGLATVLGVVAIFAVWANRQLLDTGSWTRTNVKLIESPPIRSAVSGYLTDQLYANVDVAGELKKGLPSQLQPLANPAAGALRDVVQKAVELLLERAEVQELWRKANEITHAELVRLVENRERVVRLPGGGAVVLDLRPMLGEVAKQVGASPSIVEKIPPKVAQIHIVSSSQLRTMQNAVNLLRGLALALPPLVVALYVLAVYLARGRRRHTLIAIGVALIAAGLVALVARGIAGRKVVDALATTEAVRPAAQAAWSIGTSTLADVAWSTVLLGIPLILAGVLAGPTRTAVSVRRVAAPYLRDRPDVAFGALGMLLLLLFAWGPIGATRSLSGIAIIVVLAVVGMEALRRQVARELPDAHLRSSDLTAEQPVSKIHAADPPAPHAHDEKEPPP
jgi:hypothetical protein